MIHMRPSRQEDVPALRELWSLSFGDSGAYLDNFFLGYYAPDRVLVLEEDGVIRAMTAWFDTPLVLPEGERWPAAYLYAVCTHPDSRGKGFAGSLLRYCDFFLREERCFQAVTTVPARPDLHIFFGQNGFRECFVHREFSWSPTGSAVQGALEPLEPQAYLERRRALLQGTGYTDLDGAGMAYQAGACALSGGGLFGLDTPNGPGCLCAEGGENGLMVVKELLCPPQDREAALELLHRQLGAASYLVRTPDGEHPFGMLKWLRPGLESRWDWSRRAYLGLAFD